MNLTQKITLLKRKFLSSDYSEEFLKNYQQFIDTGIDAFSKYKKYRKHHPNFTPNKEVDTEEFFWEGKVLPNFKRMYKSSENVALLLKNKDPDLLMYLGGLAGDFRGLSRGFDGIREEFMDLATPELRVKYLELYNQASQQARNIEKAINEWWKDSSILDEEITGAVDEKELLNYLEPGESIQE